MAVAIKITRIKDHFEVYIDDKFLCSTDTFSEAVEELEKNGF